MKTVSIIVVGNESVYQGLVPTQNARVVLSSGEDVCFAVVHLPDPERLALVVSDRLADATVLVTDPAEDAVARAIAAGTPPAQAMEDWIRVVSGVLAVQRRNRRKIALVAASAFSVDPDACCDEICLRFFKESSNSEIMSDTVSTYPAAWDAWHIVLASHTLASSPGAQPLDQEFAAAALPVIRPTVTTDAAYSEVSDILESARSMSERNEQLVSENGELQCLLSSEREKLKADIESLSTELSLLKTHLKSIQEELGAGRVALLKSKQTHSLKLQAERARSETQIEELSNEVSSLKARISEISADLDKANQALIDSETEASEAILLERKVAAEHRAAQDAHRTLLLKQLTTVQTELRDTVLRLNQAGINAANKVEVHNAALLREAEIEELRAAIRAFETSTSWAVTRPLRAIKTALTGNGRS